MKKQLFFVAVVLLSYTTKAQDIVLNCQQNKLLFPKQTLFNDPENADISADKSQISQNDSYALSGNVSINSAQYYLSADKVNIQKSKQTLVANGNVQFQNQQLMLSGNKALINKQAEDISFVLEQVRFHYPDSKINGEADKLSGNNEKQVFDKVSYSLCPLNKTDWQLKASKITLNSKTNKGTAKGVVFEFLGLPIFYLPHYEWTLKGRSSGFLASSFANYQENSGSDKDGYQIRIPYYFNIAADRDLLLTLNHLSSRGVVLESEYRQLIAANKGRFKIAAEYLKKDEISNKKRWLLNSKLNLSLNPKTRLKIKTERVSDPDYFKEIAHRNTDKETLLSEFNLSYKNPKNNLSASAFAETEQLVNGGTSSYTRAPEFSISKSIKLRDRTIKLSLISTKFAHKDATQTTAIRTHAKAKFSRKIATKSYLLEPSLELSSTYYKIDNSNQNKRRNIANFNLDTQFFFERQISLFDTNLIQTLTPRIAYRYTPKKNQNALPNFDSFKKHTSYEGLFSGQRVIGIDRINDANDITVGLESDFIDARTGDAYLGLKIAQTLYGDQQIIDGISKDYSDIAAVADYSFGNFSFNNALQYDPKSHKISQRNSAISYRLSGKKFLTLAHHNYNDDKSAELYGAYPLNDKIHIFGGANYSITDDISNKQILGVAYESCCWAWRAASFKKHLGDGSYDKVVNFELVLKGLTSTTSSLSSQIADNIPYYNADLNE